MTIELLLCQVISLLGEDEFTAFKNVCKKRTKRLPLYKSAAARLAFLWTFSLNRRTLFIISESAKLENSERGFTFVRFFSSDEPDFAERLTADILAKTNLKLTKKTAT